MRIQVALLFVVAVTAAEDPIHAQSPITSIALSDDETQLVAASEGELQIREWPSLRVIDSHPTDIGRVQSLRFSPDGTRLLVVGGIPSEQGRWNVLTWPELETVCFNADHRDVIQAATWISDQRFVTASSDKVAIEWQLQGRDGVLKRRSFTGHSRRALAVAYVPRANLLVTAGVDQSLRVWPIDDDPGLDPLPRNISRSVRVLDNHTAPVHDLAVRPGEHRLPYLASAAEDKTVRIWQPTIGRLVRFAKLPTEAIAISWSHDGQSIAVGCTDGRLRVVDANRVAVQQTIDAFDGWLYAVQTARDGSVAVGGTGGQLRRLQVSGQP